ncbi:MlaD family protein [Mycobacterium sp. IS-3022]|uniref:MlaD family protein n=1 Tax=Mycobacterium sp. IS-3022 TaxID=1772277 RepID=UPI0007418071|nr:MlaD family protein [Mycobacterium sp. IS-3022]KUH97233.1 mammalian cell entry protein [Mycobacterium sp. IS-3022]KUH97451.1 mammalian cell entry protein [Mycobacterium sp. IS-3022]
MKFNAGATLVILAIITLIGAGYMSLGVLDMGPTKQVTRIQLMLEASGGLLSTSDVTMRGIKVGRVTGIQATPAGLAVAIDLDSEHPVPVDSPISVEALSVAGEQYIDFKPEVIAPPYLSDGAVIPADRVTSAVTVSDILARGNALFSALNHEDLRTVVTNLAEAITGNDETLDSLATTAGLYARMVQENKQLLNTLFGNLSTLTTGMGDLKVGAVFSETGHILPSAVPEFVRLIREFDSLSQLGTDMFGDDGAIESLVDKISQYIELLAGPLSTFATVLEPATAPIRDVEIDAGHWLDFWKSTFNDEGAMRLQLLVPEWPQP